MDAENLDINLAWQISKPGDRILIVEYPSKLRRGDSGIIALTFENMYGSTPTRDNLIELSESSNPGDILDDDIHPVVRARLDLTGISFSPQGELIAPLKQEIPVIFTWKIHPHDEITTTGTIWLYLDFVSTNQGDIRSRALLAQEMNFEVVSMIGLAGPTARILGVLGIALGLSLSVDRIGKWVKQIPDHLRRKT